MSQLSRLDLPEYGPVWNAGSRADDLKKLAAEVDEYFALGLEVNPGTLVVDVGANVGMFAIATARRAPEVNLIAVEPIPALHAALARNFDENPHLRKAKPRSRLVRAGLSKDDRETEVEFAYFTRFPSDTTRYLDGKRVEFERHFEQRGASMSRSIERRVPGWAGRKIGWAVGSFVASMPRGAVGQWVSDRVTGIQRVRCPMTTLGHVLDEDPRPVGVLKVDVEGAEIDVLLGARDEQWKRIHQVVLEANDLDGRLEKIRGILNERGLTKQVITEPQLSVEQNMKSFLLLASRPAS